MNTVSANGLGTQLRRLLELLDGDLEQVYREDHEFYVPRFTPVMKALAGGDRLTIKEIAAQSSVSHSAASQTVSKLVAHGLVRLEPDSDRRSRRVSLTAQGQALLPWLSQRWAATNAAADALDAELAYPLSALLGEVIQLLQTRSFAQRIRAIETRKETQS